MSITFCKLLFIKTFLPNGYVAHQTWDKIQVFASSITGALATGVVLSGTGFEKTTIYAVAALFTGPLNLLLRVPGMHLFTYIYFKENNYFISRAMYSLHPIFIIGPDLEQNPKKWRWTASILHDMAYFVALLSVFLPRCYWFLVYTSCLFTYVTGLIRGATRMAIIQQQLFTMIHLYADYRAIRRLQLGSLNINRLTIAIDSFLDNCSVPSTFDCNQAEPLFKSLCGTRHLGVSLKELYEYAEKNKTQIVEAEDYVLSHSSDTNIGHICLAKSCSDSLKPFVHLHFLRENCSFIHETYSAFRKALGAKGYKLCATHLSYGDWRYI